MRNCCPCTAPYRRRWQLSRIALSGGRAIQPLFFARLGPAMDESAKALVKAQNVAAKRENLLKPLAQEEAKLLKPRRDGYPGTRLF